MTRTKEIKAYAPGIYARSEELVQATRDADRGRVPEAVVEKRRDEDLARFLETQRGANLDYLSDGLLGWQDVFRPFDESANGLRPGSLTRFLDTNTFFRAPAATDETLALAEPLGEPLFRVGSLPSGGWVATLPSPYAMAEYAAGDVTPREVAEKVLAPQMGWLAEHGCAMAVFQETAMFGGGADVSALGDALDVLGGFVPVALQLPFGDAGEVIGELVGLDGVEAIGVDFYSTDVSGLPRPFPKTLLAGVVDARNSLLEYPAEVAAFGREIFEGIEGELHLVSNGDLQFVPERIAREKILRLGEAARILKEEA
ncbi:MAG: hypothetical protein H0U65_01445 [Rubrobacter sp.]|nr:hypothetical protein [Rubrobacter sp.]